MRTAAAESFDLFRKDLFSTITKRSKVFAEYISLYPYAEIMNSGGVDWLFKMLSTAFGTFDSNRRETYLSKVDGDNCSLGYIGRGATLVLPKNIPNFNIKNISPDKKFRVALTSIEFGFTGLYHSPKTGTGELENFPPNINLGMTTMRRKAGYAMHDLFSSILKLYKEGKTNPSAQAIMRPINKWLREVDEELLLNKFTYIHEYIHMLDDARYRSKSTHPGNIEAGIKNAYDETVTDKKPYYTSDAEFNAYFQQAASVLENAVKSYLIANTSDAMGRRAAERHAGWNSATYTEQCIVLAELVTWYMEVMIENALELGWVKKHLETMGVQNIGLKNPLDLFCLVYVTEKAFSTSKHFLTDIKNPKRKKKMLNRILSLSNDLKTIVKNYKNDMKDRKVPSIQKYNLAKEMFIPNSTTARIEHTKNPFYVLRSVNMGSEPFSIVNSIPNK